MVYYFVYMLLPRSLDVSLKLFEKLVTTFIQVLIDYYFAFKDSVTEEKLLLFGV